MDSLKRLNTSDIKSDISRDDLALIFCIVNIFHLISLGNLIVVLCLYLSFSALAPTVPITVRHKPPTKLINLFLSIVIYYFESNYSSA